ncbi:PGF-CTERM sorting domain-containing protein, partial [Methanosarcina sp. MSH10X1]|uniref:S-layer protein domain-containing protein n=1 Tax=Methanosarcina sp. MSH10X1 TaxID=2507075 RepID=UPI000FFBA929
VFQGAVDSIAQIEGLWLIDYANAMTIESDDEFGELNDVSIQGDSLVISNEDSFTLTRDSEEEIAEGMFFKIADTPANQLRYYPFVERTVSDNETAVDDNETVVDDNETVVDDNETVVDDNETVDDDNVTDTPGETPAEEEPTEDDTPAEDDGQAPGFGVVLGLAGLLAVVYLVRRNN